MKVVVFLVASVAIQCVSATAQVVPPVTPDRYENWGDALNEFTDWGLTPSGPPEPTGDGHVKLSYGWTGTITIDRQPVFLGSVADSVGNSCRIPHQCEHPCGPSQTLKKKKTLETTLDESETKRMLNEFDASVTQTFNYQLQSKAKGSIPGIADLEGGSTMGWEGKFGASFRHAQETILAKIAGKNVSKEVEQDYEIPGCHVLHFYVGYYIWAVLQADVSLKVDVELKLDDRVWKLDRVHVSKKVGPIRAIIEGPTPAHRTELVVDCECAPAISMIYDPKPLDDALAAFGSGEYAINVSTDEPATVTFFGSSVGDYVATEARDDQGKLAVSALNDRPASTDVDLTDTTRATYFTRNHADQPDAFTLKFAKRSGDAATPTIDGPLTVIPSKQGDAMIPSVLLSNLPASKADPAAPPAEVLFYKDDELVAALEPKFQVTEKNGARHLGGNIRVFDTAKFKDDRSLVMKATQAGETIYEGAVGKDIPVRDPSNPDAIAEGSLGSLNAAPLVNVDKPEVKVGDTVNVTARLPDSHLDALARAGYPIETIWITIFDAMGNKIGEGPATGEVTGQAVADQPGRYVVRAVVGPSTNAADLKAAHERITKTSETATKRVPQEWKSFADALRAMEKQTHERVDRKAGAFVKP